MIKTLSPYSTTAKTAEIMSRYRPIAPKPEALVGSMGNAPSLSQKITQSPYLRKLWPQLQARPTRTRKRGRATISPPASLKRPRTTVTSHVLGESSSAQTLSLQGFSHSALSQIPATNVAVPNFCSTPSAPSLVTLPLLSPVPDLNTAVEIAEEKDLLNQLNVSPRATGVIAPQPVRPVGSSISVGCINEDLGLILAAQTPKRAEEVEEEVESEVLPAVVSDSNNRVRLANSAYKEMVGQPECPWLDSMVGGDGKQSGGGRRICGEVRLSMSRARVPVWSKGFSCWVRIEWDREGKKKRVNAFCDVMRLACESKDYLFTWRFHTRPLSSQSSSNV